MNNNHGGKRAGAGRKPLRDEAKVVTSICVTPEIKRFLGGFPQSQSEVVETIIRQSKLFRRWNTNLDAENVRLAEQRRQSDQVTTKTKLSTFTER